MDVNAYEKTMTELQAKIVKRKSTIFDYAVKNKRNYRAESTSQELIASSSTSINQLSQREAAETSSSSGINVPSVQDDEHGPTMDDKASVHIGPTAAKRQGPIC